MACRHSRIRRAAEGRSDRGLGSVSGGRRSSLVAPTFDDLCARLYLHSPSSACFHIRRSHRRRDPALSGLRLCLTRSRSQRSRARIAAQPRARRCGPTRAGSFMSARAAEQSCARRRAIVASSAPMVQSRARRSSQRAVIKPKRQGRESGSSALSQYQRARCADSGYRRMQRAIHCASRACLGDPVDGCRAAYFRPDRRQSALRNDQILGGSNLTPGHDAAQRCPRFNR